MPVRQGVRYGIICAADMKDRAVKTIFDWRLDK